MRGCFVIRVKCLKGIGILRDVFSRAFRRIYVLALSIAITNRSTFKRWALRNSTNIVKATLLVLSKIFGFVFRIYKQQLMNKMICLIKIEDLT